MSTDNKDTTLNDQIADSIAAMQNLLLENGENNVALIAYQIMAQAAGLAMLNAVNQQQQMYILQNAVTTAAAKSALESSPDEAIKIINDAMQNNNVLETFNGLKNFMDELTKTYDELKKKTATNKKEPDQSSGNKTKSGSSGKTT